MSYIQHVCCYVDEGTVPKKRSRKSRLKTGRDKVYDSDQDGYDRKGSRKPRASQLKGMFVIDDGDEDCYQSRMR